MAVAGALAIASHPQAFAEPIRGRPAFGAPRAITDVQYVQRKDALLTADLLIPARGGPFPVVLLVHGGGWDSGDKAQNGGIARFLANRGYATMTINYRLAPRWKYPAQIEDCRAALDWLRREGPRYGFDTTRIGAWGFSAGAQLVALLATTEPKDKLRGLRGAVLASGPMNLEQLGTIGVVQRYIGGALSERREAYREASPINHVSAATPPIFLIHGMLDRLVPMAQSEAMKSALDGAGVPAELHRVADAGHGGLTPGTRQAVQAAVGFLDRYVRRSSGEAPRPG